MTTTNKIQIVRGKEGKIIAGQVTKTFRKRANIFGTTEYNQWQKFIEQNPKTKMLVVKTSKTKRTPKVEKKIRPTYDKIIDFINTQDNAKSYLEEMNRIKDMAAINGNSYNTVVKWFNNTFENTSAYQLVFRGILEENPKAEKVTDIRNVVNA